MASMAGQDTPRAALRAVVAAPALRRAELAWMSGWAGEWMTLVALLVVAYQQLGVAGVGLLGLARSLPAAIGAPLSSGIADRAPKERVLLIVHGGRAVLTAATALALWLDVPVLAIIILVVPLEGSLAVLHRPTHMALLPGLARDPRELVAANVLSAVAEGGGVLAGPAIGGLIVATVSPLAGLLVGAAVAGVAALLIAPIRPATMRRSTATPREGLLETATGGMRALAANPAARLLVAIAAAQTFVRGTLTVLLVAASVRLLGLGEEGVGYLTAAIGAGGLLGALGSVAFVGRRLAPTVIVGLVLWGVPLVVLGFVPVAAIAFVLMFAVGIGNALFDVGIFTLLQRTCRNEERGRIFGVLEALIMLTVALGSIVGPVLVGVLGVKLALVAAGLILPIVAILTFRPMLGIDDAVVVPDQALELLKGVPSFEPLPLTVLESLAAEMRPVTFDADADVVIQGTIGNNFYVIRSGLAEAIIDGTPVRRMGPGESFGEIALMRDVPRTATVRTLEPTDLLALDRSAFLSAISGARGARSATERVVEARIGDAG